METDFQCQANNDLCEVDNFELCGLITDIVPRNYCSSAERDCLVIDSFKVISGEETSSTRLFYAREGPLLHKYIAKLFM